MLQQDVTQQMLSSLALFKGIANSHKGDVWAIVRDFIIATVKRRKLESCDVQTLRDEMVQEFNIDIENAVLSKVLNNLDLVSYSKSLRKFSATEKLSTFDIDAFNADLNHNQNQCDRLLNELYEFYCKENNIDSIEPKVKILIQDYFFRYIIDKEKVCRDNNIIIIINRFALESENDDEHSSIFPDIKSLFPSENDEVLLMKVKSFNSPSLNS